MCSWHGQPNLGAPLTWPFHSDGTKPIDVALFYAEHGLPVFPVKPRGKQPLTGRGFKDATTDGAQIREWWTKWPSANIGIPTGSASGIIALDVDSQEGASRLSELGAAVITLTSVTGRGHHLFFKAPKQGIPCRTSIVSGVDVRGDGGYVVAPLSIHETGFCYQWDDDNGMGWGTPLANVPASLSELLGGKAQDGSFELPATILKSVRNDTLFKFACSLRAKGLSKKEIESACFEASQTRCKPPISADEVKRINESAAKYPPAGPPSDDDPREKSEPGERSSNQVQQLIELTVDAELFHTPDRIAYASIEMDGHIETHGIKSRALKQWLLRRFYEESGRPPRMQNLDDALATLEAEALFSGREEAVFLRVAQDSSAIYVDLGRHEWDAVRVTARGWDVISNPPVKFRRTRSVGPLPVPLRGGSIDLLSEFLNLDDGQDFKLVVCWLVACLWSRGPYPVLVIQGEQGSCKSTMARVLFELVDPGKPGLRTVPRNEHELLIAATNTWMLGFDNLSTMPMWLSDALCRLSTGGGFSVRQLYTDLEEILFDAQRPVLLTGIADPMRRDDLRDRSIVVTLPPIGDDAREPEEAFWSRFQEKQPLIMGAMLDALSTCLREVENIELETVPRMADFALRATAAERGFGWPRGSFMAAYTANREVAAAEFLESDAVAVAIRDWLGQTEWTGTAAELLTELNGLIAEDVRKRKSWPTAPNSLSRRVMEAGPALRRIGIDVERRRGRTRILAIRRIRPETVAIDETVVASPVRDDVDGNDGGTVNYPATSPGGIPGMSDEDYEREERISIQEEVSERFSP